MVEILVMSVYKLVHVFYEFLERLRLARRQAALLCSPACDSLGQIKQPLQGKGRLFFPGSDELLQAHKVGQGDSWRGGNWAC